MNHDKKSWDLKRERKRKKSTMVGFACRTAICAGRGVYAGRRIFTKTTERIPRAA
jgi:hypothetical protein